MRKYIAVLVSLVVVVFIRFFDYQPSVDEIISDIVYVDIKGEVNMPGVYTVDSETRVFEVISYAGGLTTSANISDINLSLKVVDEMLIFIPGEATSNKLSINMASLEEFTVLPSIGKVTAGNIVAYRELNGNFTSIEGLLDVNGIGEKTFADIKEYITI